MKFNERNVAYFANCNSPVDKEGLLLKRGGEINKSFQKRWFILKGNLLFYFAQKGDKDPVGVIILEGCRVELADSEDSQYTFQLSFPGEGARTYIFAAFNQEEMEAWMRALSCSSYDYMKAMVDELQRQLDELTHHTHGEGVVQPGRFSYAPVGSDDFVLLGADAGDKGPGIYERGKTESLAHRGAPRPNAFNQRNSLPVSQFSNPSYAIWDPLVPKEVDEEEEEQGQGSSSSSSHNFTVNVTAPPEVDSSDDDINDSGAGSTFSEREKFMGRSAQLQQQLQAHAIQSRNPSTAPGASTRNTQVKSVFYENVANDVPKPITRGVSARARLVNKITGNRDRDSIQSQVGGIESKKTAHSVFHDSDIRSFREMHEQFGLLIVKKINEARQRKMSST